jgi:hypothetical protein
MTPIAFLELSNQIVFGNKPRHNYQEKKNNEKTTSGENHGGELAFINFYNLIFPLAIKKRHCLYCLTRYASPQLGIQVNRSLRSRRFIMGISFV